MLAVPQAVYPVPAYLYEYNRPYQLLLHLMSFFSYLVKGFCKRMPAQKEQNLQVCEFGGRMADREIQSQHNQNLPV